MRSVQIRGVACAISAAALLTGCTIGRTGSDLPLASQPVGATAGIELGPRSVTAELLSADAEALIVMFNGRVTRIPWSAVRRVSFSEVGGHSHRGPSAPEATKLRSIQAISRFGAPLSPEIRARLLQLGGQSAMDVLP